MKVEITMTAPMTIEEPAEVLHLRIRDCVIDPQKKGIFQRKIAIRVRGDLHGGNNNEQYLLKGVLEALRSVTSFALYGHILVATAVRDFHYVLSGMFLPLEVCC